MQRDHQIIVVSLTQVLLLDEPLAALDVQTRREVRQELRRILANVGVTTVMVTHQYLEALLFGQHILVLDHGRVIQQGDQRDLLEHPRSPYVAELVGVNFFRGRIIRYEANTMCVLAVPQGTRTLEIAATLSEASDEDAFALPSSEASVVVEPRSITLYQQPPDSSARNVFHGEIVQVLRLGSTSVDRTDGVVRVSIALDKTQSLLPPLTAEITQASAERMDLSEGKMIYAAFKATAAKAYL